MYIITVPLSTKKQFPTPVYPTHPLLYFHVGPDCSVFGVADQGATRLTLQLDASRTPKTTIDRFSANHLSIWNHDGFDIASIVDTY